MSACPYATDCGESDAIPIHVYRCVLATPQERRIYANLAGDNRWHSIERSRGITVDELIRRAELLRGVATEELLDKAVQSLEARRGEPLNVTAERVGAALATTGTTTAAAEVLGLHRSTVHSYLSDLGHREQIREALDRLGLGPERQAEIIADIAERGEEVYYNKDGEIRSRKKSPFHQLKALELAAKLSARVQEEPEEEKRRPHITTNVLAVLGGVDQMQALASLMAGASKPSEE